MRFRDRSGQRPATSKRGYGAKHQALRKAWARQVALGIVVCARCDRLIAAGEPWDLGHDDEDRSRYNGPEHAKCNRAAPHRRAVVVVRSSRVW